MNSVAQLTVSFEDTQKGGSGVKGLKSNRDQS